MEGEERSITGKPTQTLAGDRELFKTMEDILDPITTFTLDIRFDMVWKHKIGENNYYDDMCICQI